MRKRIGGHLPPDFFMAASPPPTAVQQRVGLAGMAGASLSFMLTVWLEVPALPAILLLLSLCAAPMWWIEWRRFTPHPLRALQLCVPPSAEERRRRVFGLLGVGLLFLASSSLQLTLAPASAGGLYDLTLPLLAVSLIWLTWQLTSFQARNSSVSELGVAFQRVLFTRRLDPGVAQTILPWMVKAFFLPLMLAWSYTWLAKAADIGPGNWSWGQCFTLAMAWLYAVDTAFATVGYLSTDARIGAEIRSVDATWTGWLAALSCYPPLSILVLHTWLDYKDGLEWQAWLQEWPIASIAWGTAILLLTGVYTWSSVAFGPRFSNLTHRGIITTGPYRYTKHPAYLCKNLSWWLISIPFISNTDKWTAISNCIALAGVNAIYWLRARTEEKHLMRDETYQRYAEWIARHGVFSRCAVVHKVP